MQIINFILVAAIIVSFVFYFYYKTKQFRSTLPIRKKWYAAKAGVSFGVFVLLFGLNTTIIYPTAIGYIVAAIFVLYQSPKQIIQVVSIGLLLFFLTAQIPLFMGML